MFFKRRKSFDEYVQEGKKDSKVIFLDVREEDVICIRTHNWQY